MHSGITAPKAQKMGLIMPETDAGKSKINALSKKNQKSHFIPKKSMRIH
jgi:hypothetical protein